MRTGHVEVFSNADAVAQVAAERFVTYAATAITSTDRFAVALSGGSTPRGMYAWLATERYRTRIDWSRVHVFWSDERCVPPDDPASNYRMARESLLDHVAVPAANIHRIAGEEEPDSAAAAYERELRRFFGVRADTPANDVNATFDLALLGMGTDGHTASLFPATPAIRENRRWVVAHEVTAVPAWRITLTPQILNSAAAVVFLVTAGEKAETLRRALEGPRDPERIPAQAIAPASGHLSWLVDAAAASALERS